jgi:hypothetical protein
LGDFRGRKNFLTICGIVTVGCFSENSNVDDIKQILVSIKIFHLCSSLSIFGYFNLTVYYKTAYL